MSALGRIIHSVATDTATKTLTITWTDGTVTIKAMAPLIGRRKVFRPLEDADLFARAAVVNDGRAVAWNDDIDLCADALWMEAHGAENPFVQHVTAAE